MSKNITISEGAQAKNFNSVSKLRTNLIGGGTQDWVPEDEAGLYANLGIAEIDKNGTYKAVDERLDGFSEVAVQVKPKVTTLNVSENGTYRAKKDKVDGYDVVKVEVPIEGSGGKTPVLITKEISENGTYSAESDEADGYSSVRVNVTGSSMSGKEVQGIAGENLTKMQTVKITSGSHDLSVLSDSHPQGWLRSSNNLIYRLENNKYNGYSINTGSLSEIGQDTVYQVTILGGGECACLRLHQETGSAPYHAKYKFLWSVGGECVVEFDYVNGNGYKNQIGVLNGLIAVYHGRPDQSDGLGNVTVDIYNNLGAVITQGLCNMTHGWSGMTERTVENVLPLSSNKVACWFYTGNDTMWTRNCIITETGLEGNQNILNLRYTDTLGYYAGYWYLSNSGTLKRIPVEDIVNNYEALNLSSNKMGSINQYGHFEYNNGSSYALYDVNSQSDAYSETVSASSLPLAENAGYLVYNKTYVKSNSDVINATAIFPKTNNAGVMLGVMKDNCNAGQTGTVIVLFS